MVVVKERAGQARPLSFVYKKIKSGRSRCEVIEGKACVSSYAPPRMVMPPRPDRLSTPEYSLMVERVRILFHCRL